MSTKVLVRVAAVGCAAMVIAGCGSSTPSTPSTSGTSGTPSFAAKPSTTTVVPPSEAALSAMVLQASDLPAGWKGTPYKADADDGAGDAAMTACLGIEDTEKDKAAEVHSQDYSLNEAQVTSSASSFKSAKSIEIDKAALRGPKLSACFGQLVRSQLEPTLPAGVKIDAAPMTVTQGLPGGPSNVIAVGQGTIEVTTGGYSVDVNFRIAFIAGSLVEAQVFAMNVGAPVSDSLFESAATAVAKRVAKG